MGIPLQENNVRLFGGSDVITREVQISVVTDYVTIFFS